MEVLRRRLFSASGKLKRTETFLGDSAGEPAEACSIRLEGLEAAWGEYSKTYDEILCQISAEELQTIAGDYGVAEALYYKVKTDLVCRIRASESSHATMGSAAPTVSDMKLPRISLPTFAGDYLVWCSFKDLYVSTIHSNASLASSQKLFYLKSSLAGEAASLLHSLEVSDANYSEAWEMLCDRYDNKRQLVQSHMKALFSQPVLQSEAVTGLRKLLDTRVRHVRALSSLGIKQDQWDHVLVFLIAERLDLESRREWELSYSRKEYPKFQEIKDYLEKWTRAVEASKATSKTKALGLAVLT